MCALTPLNPKSADMIRYGSPIISIMCFTGPLGKQM